MIIRSSHDELLFLIKLM